jgi:hypothetical protein
MIPNPLSILDSFALSGCPGVVSISTIRFAKISRTRASSALNTLAFMQLFTARPSAMIPTAKINNPSNTS